MFRADPWNVSLLRDRAVIAAEPQQREYFAKGGRILRHLDGVISVKGCVHYTCRI